MKSICVAFIKLYQNAFSRFFPGACRHYPSCSNYAHEAIQTHGALKGSVLGIKRIFKCHPFGTHGYDPVPDKDNPVPNYVNSEKTNLRNSAGGTKNA